MQCPKSSIALVDANAFYCSCFAAFDAALAGRPVVVLSNNDGNVIARSKEAKALGITMGQPFFELRGLVAAQHVAVFSSNHGFFAEMSERFQTLLYHYSPVVEHYSIDEAWLDLQPTARLSLDAIGREIKARVQALSGVPVSVGIATTKVLAKVAMEHAKTSAKAGGVLDLTRSKYQDLALERLPVGEVWGIGRSYAELLNRHGVTTAKALRDTDDRWARQQMTIVGLRIVHELRGIQCFPLNPQTPQRKLATVSRSFGKATEDFGEVRAAVVWFAARAAEKLRREQLLTGRLNVWLGTDRFKVTPQFSDSLTLAVAPLSNSTLELSHLALRGLERIWQPGYAIRRAGVTLSELAAEATAPRRLWEDDRFEGMKRLHQAIDFINAKFGRDTLRCGLFPSAGTWRTKAEFAAPGYTTNWGDVLRTG